MSRIGRARDDSGQALAFGALTLFFVTCFVALVLNIGAASFRKTDLQTAADEGAYAGAVALSDILSEIGWLNDAQAHLHYHAMRRAVDVTAFGVLAELAEHGPPYPSDDVVGIDNAPGRYDQAYAEAAAWLPRFSDWSTRMARIQWGLAAAGPALVRAEIFGAVHRSLGIDPATGDPRLQLGLFPDFQLIPEPYGDYRLYITRLGNGWRLEDLTGFWVEVRILSEDKWRVLSSMGLDLTVEEVSDTEYILTSSQFGTMTFDFYAGLGWVLQMPGFTVQPGPNGGFEIRGAGAPQEIRRGLDGQLQVWRNGAWEDLGGESVTVDGQQIPVHQNGVQVGADAWVDFDPIRIRFQNIEIYPGAGNVRIIGVFGPARVTVDGDYVVVNGLTTRNAEGVWYRYGREGADRIRHRLTQTAENAWLYEWHRIGAYLQVEPNRRRFGADRAILGNDPSREIPPWAYDPAANPAGWLDPATGRSLSDKAYHQTRRCWHPDDNLCPLHGGGCPGPSPALDPPLDPSADGGWHTIAGWIVCPVCTQNAGDALDDDGDGFSDVRKHQQDTYDRQRPGDPRYQVSVPTDFQAFLNSPTRELRIALPLVLTEDFFRYGINLAVWRQSDDAGQGEEFRLLPGVFPLPAGFTGRVAFASAKCGLRDPALGSYLYRVADPLARSDWVVSDPANLYVGDWEAKLWSVRTAVLDIDVDAGLTDSGLQYLVRGLLATEWETRYDDVQPAWGLPGSLGLDLLDPRLKDVIRH